MLIAPPKLQPAKTPGHEVQPGHASRSRTCMKLLWLPVVKSGDEGFAEGLQGHLPCLQVVHILSALHRMLACQYFAWALCHTLLAQSATCLLSWQ